MTLPLAGKSVLVTRPDSQAAGMVRLLESLGASAIQMPAIEIAPLEDYSALDDAVLHLDLYDWVVLTSVNGVEAIRNRLNSLGLSADSVSRRKIAVIGPATAGAAREAFKEPDLIPGEYVSEAIAESLGAVKGQRFLLARADIARPDLAELLRERGGQVTEVAAYRIVSPTVRAALSPACPDYITLTSSSAAIGTIQALVHDGHESWLNQAILACIGPITGETVRQLGYEPTIQPREYTVPALVDAIVAHATSRETVVA
jgi:uroporphyrinogen-III synthase